MRSHAGRSEGTDMKDPKCSSVAVAGDREDGAPADYARYRADVRDRLAETDIMLALKPDEYEEQHGFDPYNSAGD